MGLAIKLQIAAAQYFTVPLRSVTEKGNIDRITLGGCMHLATAHGSEAIECIYFGGVHKFLHLKFEHTSISLLGYKDCIELPLRYELILQMST